MPEVLLNLDALEHNVKALSICADRWQVKVLPVLKVVASHPQVVSVLAKHGFSSFGLAELSELAAFDAPALASLDKRLINLCRTDNAPQIVANFSRSAVTTVEDMQALNSAAASLGLKHKILPMIDLGDAREGLPVSEVAEFIEEAAAYPSLQLCGFGSIFACLGVKFPDVQTSLELHSLKRLFQEKGIVNPEVSVGGSVCCAWLEAEGAGPVTEVRLGDPFLLGTDLYRGKALPGADFRQDVCTFSARVLEVHERDIVLSTESADHHMIGQDTSFFILVCGRRRRAVLDLGFFHAEAKELVCELAGAFIAGCSSGYLVLDVTDCVNTPKVGDNLHFTASYWSLARAFRSASVNIQIVRDAGASTTGERA